MNVRIRPLRASDAARLYAIESQPEMVRYQDFEARTAESARDYCQRAIEAALATPRTWFEFAVTQESDELIARVGAGIDGDSAWLWYAVDPEYQGRGIAKAAVTLLIGQLPVTTLRIECDPRNLASCRVAEGLDFRIESEGEVLVNGEQAPSRVYSRSRIVQVHSRTP